MKVPMRTEGERAFFAEVNPAEDQPGYLSIKIGANHPDWFEGAIVYGTVEMFRELRDAITELLEEGT